MYRSIVVFGASLGAGTVVSTAGCDLYYRRLEHRIDAPWYGTISDGPRCPNATCPDAEWGIIDAGIYPDAWHGTIADASNPDGGR